MSADLRAALIPLPDLYWWAFASLALAGTAALLQLRRLREWHHLYYGIVLGALPWWPARLVGLVLLADDAVQHLAQAQDVAYGLPPRPDWSPIHRLYVWLVRRIAR